MYWKLFVKHLPGIVSALVAVGNAALLVAHILGQLQMSGLVTTSVSSASLIAMVQFIMHLKTN